MKLRIDKVATDKDGRISVAYTATEDGRSFTAYPSGHVMVFSDKTAATAVADYEPSITLEDAVRLALREWRSVDPTLSDPALAEGKIGESTVRSR